MTAKVLVPYQRAQVPTHEGSTRDYYETELRKLQITIASLVAAITQLQTSVTAASAFPIVLT